TKSHITGAGVPSGHLSQEQQTRRSLPLFNNTALRHQTSSSSTPLPRWTKRPQPSHDVSDSHIPHLRILSILCQQDVASYIAIRKPAVSSGTKSRRTVP